MDAKKMGVVAGIVGLLWCAGSVGADTTKDEAKPERDSEQELAEKEIREDMRKGGNNLVVCLKQKWNWNLYEVRAFDGLIVKRLTDSKAGDIFPRVSPDGRMITFLRAKRHLMLLHLKDMREEKLAEIGLINGTAWSPDSKRIVFDNGRKFKEQGPGLRIYDLETRKITTMGTQFQGLNLIDWSPDGKWLLMDVRASRGGLAFMSSDGKEIKDFKGIRGCHPAFSRDGRMICWNPTRRTGLTIANFKPDTPAGIDGRRVLAEAKKGEPGWMGVDPSGRWSADGKYILWHNLSQKAKLGIVRVSDGRYVMFDSFPSDTLQVRNPAVPMWGYDWLLPQRK